MTAAERAGRERTPPHPDISTITLQQVLEALVDPVRRRIVSQLHAAHRDLACGTLDLPVSKSTATHHFHVLREAGLIRQYYAGTSRMNALRLEEFDQVFPGLLPALLAQRDSDPHGDSGDGGRGRSRRRG
ncbi:MULTISPECIES: helix-turn-helix transcriptional regulator [unclassified Streptomyces]|uniref:ArsR/SmtB family transcription factor n=1 Tax=unclassified Streptomyces TaxID=2593676 RepID=UPI000C27A022|nr:helix-turn-helix transcriptional regulator [Streptomyces sp. CB02959]PJN38549.1 transcriptional regulator [Streptomyces sp. CB02959]